MSTTIPAAVPYFMTLVTTAMPANTLVWFGKQLGPFRAPIIAQVTAVNTGEWEPAEMAPGYKFEERYEIVGALSVYSGDNNHAQRLQDVYGYWNAISLALANDPALGGNVRWAYPVRFDYTPGVDKDGKGSLGMLDFAVHCEARITL